MGSSSPGRRIGGGGRAVFGADGRWAALYLRVRRVRRFGRFGRRRDGHAVTAEVSPGGVPLEEQAGVGGPDAFQRLYTPHRMAYIKGEGRSRDDECPFCSIVAMSDADGLVVARGKSVYAVLNLYPYNAGHLLIVPYRHVADYADMEHDEIVEMAFFVQRALRTLRAASGAHGFNTGMNLGHVAGAGIASHVHQHVVPRWGGDTNFMPVVGVTRVLPALLSQTRVMLAEAWAVDAAVDTPAE